MTLRAVSNLAFSGGGIGLKSGGVLAQSAVPTSVTGTTSETTLATIAIPAGAMGVNGALRILFRFSYTNSANNKTLNVKFGGSTLMSRVITTTSGLVLLIELANRGSANSQIELTATGSAFTPYSGGGAISPLTYSVDTTAAQNLLLTGTLANTGETITLEGYRVELLNP